MIGISDQFFLHSDVVRGYIIFDAPFYGDCVTHLPVKEKERKREKYDHYLGQKQSKQKELVLL